MGEKSAYRTIAKLLLPAAGNFRLHPLHSDRGQGARVTAAGGRSCCVTGTSPAGKKNDRRCW